MLITYFALSDSNKLNVEKDKITITEVQKGEFQDYIPVDGSIEPFYSFYLDLPDGGKIVHKYVEEGAMLNPGDAIVKLDNPNLSLQVMNTQSSFLQAESMSRQTSLTFEQNLLNKRDQLINLNLAILNQERIFTTNKALYNKGLISNNEFLLTKEKFETLLHRKVILSESLKRDSLTLEDLTNQGNANIELSKKYLNLVEGQLANLTVKAPIKGQLTSLSCEIGQSVPAGYQLGQIDNIDSFKVKAEVDEHYILRVKQGVTGEYDFNNQVYQLVVKTVYPQVTNGRFSIDLVFVRKHPIDIRRGQSVSIKLKLGKTTSSLLVENGGFFTETGGQWIYLIDQNGKVAKKREIKIGRQNQHFLELLSGLNEGDIVITSSYQNFGNKEILNLK